MAKSDTSPLGANAAADEEHRLLVQEFLKSASSTELGNVSHYSSSPSISHPAGGLREVQEMPGSQAVPEPLPRIVFT
jgi:hypothetical protein